MIALTKIRSVSFSGTGTERAPASFAPSPPRGGAGVRPFKTAGRSRTGGSYATGPYAAGDTRGDLIAPLPSGSIPDPVGALLERGQFAQTMLDIAALLAGLVLTFTFAAAVAGSAFMLMFVAL